MAYALRASVSEFKQALRVDQEQAHQGKTSSSESKTSFTVGPYGECGNKRPNHVKGIAELPLTPARYAVLSKTRVVYNAVLIYEGCAMMCVDGLRPMIIFQPLR